MITLNISLKNLHGPVLHFKVIFKFHNQKRKRKSFTHEQNYMCTYAIKGRQGKARQGIQAGKHTSIAYKRIQFLFSFLGWISFIIDIGLIIYYCHILLVKACHK